MNAAILALIESTARAAGCATSHPTTLDGAFTGDLALHGTPETHTSPDGVLRCLAALGVSRGPWHGYKNFRVADLSDLDGTVRGTVLFSATGATATIWSGLANPLGCFTA